MHSASPCGVTVKDVQRHYMDNFQKEMRKTEEDKRKTKSEALKVAWVIRLFIIM
jgi:hypothetical protein